MNHKHAATTKWALLSVSDKTGLTEFAQGLVNLGYQIVSSGGTAKELQNAGLRVHELASFTGQPEIMSGRVKTLNPKIFAGILADRENPEHLASLLEQNYVPIELVVVNFYPFIEQVSGKNLPAKKAIEFIDIGGPSMIRAAAKNFHFVTPIIDPSDYALVLSELKTHGATSLETRGKLAAKTFARTSAYEHAISTYFSDLDQKAQQQDEKLPTEIILPLKKSNQLRYGENPGQNGAFYKNSSLPMDTTILPLHEGKELSYNNYLDCDAALRFLQEFSEQSATVVIKHTNACGLAASGTLSPTELFERAWNADSLSAFGGVIGFNHSVDKGVVESLSGKFVECLIAPDYTVDALSLLLTKKNIRVLKYQVQKNNMQTQINNPHSIRTTLFGYLVQSPMPAINPHIWKTVSQRAPIASELSDLQFALKVVKQLKSNAIVLAHNQQTIGVGCGLTSRIDALKLALSKAKDLGHSLKGSVIASDAFFPFSDCVDLAASHGIGAIIQPGGSIRDQDSIDCANKHNIAMIFSGQRYFVH